ncbi:hypothetical protein ACN47E_002835 [Coniothyrium glycines]
MEDAHSALTNLPWDTGTECQLLEVERPVSPVLAVPESYQYWNEPVERTFDMRKHGNRQLLGTSNIDYDTSLESR